VTREGETIRLTADIHLYFRCPICKIMVQVDHDETATPDDVAAMYAAAEAVLRRHMDGGESDRAIMRQMFSRTEGY